MTLKKIPWLIPREDCPGLAPDGNSRLGLAQMADPESHSPEVMVNPLRHLLAEWALIKRYWVTFACVAAVCIAATWYVASAYYSSMYAQQIDTVKSNNTYL